MKMLGAFRPALGLVLLAVVLSFVLARLIPGVWPRMATNGAILSAVALGLVDVGWRQVWKPRLRHVVTGVAAALALYVLGLLVVTLLVAVPGIPAQVASLYAWKDAIAPGLMLPLLAFIVLTEEIVWRSAVTLPFAARLGAWPGVVLASLGFAAAHVAMGVPVLVLAALGAGGVWSLMTVKTRSAVPAFVCHLLWDLAVLVWLPYPAR